MNFRIFSVTSAPFVLCFLAGCTAVEPIKSEPDPRLDQVLTAVNQCLANQVQTTTQLENQAQQLQLQRQQMQVMGEQLENSRKEGTPTVAPALVDCPKPPKASNAQVVGYIEQVWIPDLRATLPALIDTTVETSALDVQHIEEFERDGKRWVKFTVLDASDQPVWLEHKIKRTVVSPSNSDDPASRRPVVRMGFTIGRVNQTADFVLYKRQHKTYQLKLGRDVLQDVIVVDVSKKNIAPYAPEKVPPEKVPPEKPAAKDAKNVKNVKDAKKGSAQ